MSVSDPVTLLQSILTLVDYSNQLAGASKEIEGYSKTIAGTTDLVKQIREKLTDFGHLLDDRDKVRILRELREADDELKSAWGLVEKIEKRNRHWSKNVTWIFRDKAAAQRYCTAIAQSHSTLEGINTRLFFIGLVPMRMRSGEFYIPELIQRASSPGRRAFDDLSHRSIHHSGNSFPLTRRSSLSSLHIKHTDRPNFKKQDENLEIKFWLLQRARNTW